MRRERREVTGHGCLRPSGLGSDNRSGRVSAVRGVDPHDNGLALDLGRRLLVAVAAGHNQRLARGTRSRRAQGKREHQIAVDDFSLHVNLLLGSAFFGLATVAPGEPRRRRINAGYHSRGELASSKD